MKKIFTISILLLAFFGKSFSQNPGFQKDNFFIIGSFGGNSFVSKDTDDIKFNFGTKLGYFVSKNTSVGIGLQFSSDNYFNSNVFVRRYYTPEKQFSIFTELAIGYFSQEVEKVKSIGLSASVSPGFHYFINENFAIESSVGLLSYSNSFPQISGAKSTQKIDLSLSVQKINIGLICKF